MIDSDILQRTIRTALLTAYPRRLSGIPLSYEILKQGMQAANRAGIELDRSLFSDDLAVELEGRYRALDRLLDVFGVDWVVELGAGVTPRGLNRIAKCIGYRELDLPMMAEIKREIVESLANGSSPPEIVSCDVSDIPKLDRMLRPSPLARFPAVLNEGLLWYLSWDQKNSLARSIHNSLSNSGGVWITSDCPPMRREGGHSGADPAMSCIAHSAGVSRSSGFVSVSHFNDYFERRGFDIQIFSPYELMTSRLCSQLELHISDDEARRRLETYASIAVMKPR